MVTNCVQSVNRRCMSVLPSAKRPYDHMLFAIVCPSAPSDLVASGKTGIFFTFPQALEPIAFELTFHMFN